MARVVFDANVIIALYEDTDVHHSWAVDCFTLLQAHDFVLSPLTYAEVLVSPEREKVAAKFVKNISRMDLEITTLGIEHAHDLASVRVETKLRMPDAVVLQTAIERDAAIATTDSQLAKAARERGIPVYQPEG